MSQFSRLVGSAFRSLPHLTLREAPVTLALVMVSFVLMCTVAAADEPARTKEPLADKKVPQAIYHTARAERNRLVCTFSATGTLQPRGIVEIGAQVTGRILLLGKDKNTTSGTVDSGSEVEGPVLDNTGKVVKPGTLLAQIDDEPYKIKVDLAEAVLGQAKADLKLKTAQLAQATADWNRAQKLLGTGGIAQAEYDQYQANFKTAQAQRDLSEAAIAVAQANLKTARTNLAYTKITAPVKGVIIDRRVNVGQTVVANLSAPSLFLIDKEPNKLELWATVREADVGQIKVDQEVSFTLNAYPGRSFKGRVVPQGKLAVRLNAPLDQNAVTYTAVIRVENVEKSGVKLLPNMTAEATFTVAVKEKALLVPNAALRWEPTKQQIAPEVRKKYFDLKNKKRSSTDADTRERGFIWMEGKDGFVRYLEVFIGLSDGVRTEILGVVGGEGLPEKAAFIVGEDKSNDDMGANSMGPTNLLVMPSSASSGSVLTLTANDADAIARDCPAVKSVAAVVRTRAQLTFADKKWTPLFIYGTTPSFLHVRERLELEMGDPFTDADVRNNARVCLIGSTIKHELFNDKSPIGREIRIQNVTFKVVGVLKVRGSNKMGLDQDDIVIAPWTSIKARVSGTVLPPVNQDSGKADTVNSLSQIYPGSKDQLYPAVDPLRALDYPQQARFTNIDQILVRDKSEEDVPRAVRQITDLLRRRHNIKSGQPDDFDVRDLTKMAKALGDAKKP